VPLYPFIPLLGIGSCVWLISSVPIPVLTFFAWYVLGAILLYFVYGMHNSELAKGRDVMADDETPYFPEDAPRDSSGNPTIRP
jgi:APA family basic amino acid/polyamine antiporter